MLKHFFPSLASLSSYYSLDMTDGATASHRGHGRNVNRISETLVLLSLAAEIVPVITQHQVSCLGKIKMTMH